MKVTFIAAALVCSFVFISNAHAQIGPEGTTHYYSIDLGGGQSCADLLKLAQDEGRLDGMSCTLLDSEVTLVPAPGKLHCYFSCVKRPRPRINRYSFDVNGEEIRE